MAVSISGLSFNVTKKPTIKYTETTNNFPGVKVSKEKEMSTDSYFKKTCLALAGSQGNIISALQGFQNSISDIEYDQDSINSAMWSVGDANQDGYIDNEEYQNLYYNAVTGRPANNSGILNCPVTFNFMTQEQANALHDLYQADEGIDANGDGVLSRDEFDQAALNYILTEQNKPSQE